MRLGIAERNIDGQHRARAWSIQAVNRDQD
jgi:hypothetical protein